MKCYFYPEYLNSDDCDSVFDVTRSSRQNTDYSLELVRTSGKFFHLILSISVIFEEVQSSN